MKKLYVQNPMKNPMKRKTSIKNKNKFNFKKIWYNDKTSKKKKKNFFSNIYVFPSTKCVINVRWTNQSFTIVPVWVDSSLLMLVALELCLFFVWCVSSIQAFSFFLCVSVRARLSLFEPFPIAFDWTIEKSSPSYSWLFCRLIISRKRSSIKKFPSLKCTNQFLHVSISWHIFIAKRPNRTLTPQFQTVWNINLITWYLVNQNLI